VFISHICDETTNGHKPGLFLAILGKRPKIGKIVSRNLKIGKKIIGQITNLGI
jgi:hypothetical protein